MERQAGTYLGEFRSHWPTLMGAMLGLALGTALNTHVIGAFCFFMTGRGAAAGKPALATDTATTAP